MDTKTVVIPIGKFILMRKEVEKPSGLVLPDNAKDQAGKTKMYVTAIGDECTKVQLGDLVITAVKDAFGKFQYDDAEHYLTNEEAVACVVRAKE